MLQRLNKEVIEGGCWLYVWIQEHHKSHCLSTDPEYCKEFTEVLATTPEDGFFAAILSKDDDVSEQPTPA